MTYLALIMINGEWTATTRDGKLCTTTLNKEGEPEWYPKHCMEKMPLIAVHPRMTVPTEDILTWPGPIHRKKTIREKLREASERAKALPLRARSIWTRPFGK